jgi:hypothetical protein
MEKKKTPRSAAYLQYVRGHHCLVTGTDYGVVAHHLRTHHHGGGVALKPSDYRTVPLNQMRHMELHQIGEKSFWKKYGIIPEMAIAEMLRVWILRRYLVELPRIEDADLAIPYIEALENFITKENEAED